VADQAADALLAWARSPTHVDERLADQTLPFLARARGPSAFTCPAITSHLRTVAWVVEQFLPCRIRLAEGPPARVEVDPAAA
jgi:RNA 3'-terminal phosphate cyclase